MNKQRESWSGRAGFIMACMGAAIGLGNIWLFHNYDLGSYLWPHWLIQYRHAA
ncbi:MAG: hypothetical protein EOL87_00685 [Spartobacteria bacterium]|nr:hypothetical protein [Spartobacteria bacterium]